MPVSINAILTVSVSAVIFASSACMAATAHRFKSSGRAIAKRHWEAISRTRKSVVIFFITSSHPGFELFNTF
jgi:hypothetical protein